MANDVRTRDMVTKDLDKLLESVKTDGQSLKTPNEAATLIQVMIFRSDMNINSFFFFHRLESLEEILQVNFRR